jgi:hypothetical protein
MNKPVAFVCACVAGFGLLILSRSAYCTIVYGHGNLEAGNFHRCIYLSERDPKTGKIRRDWDTNWELVSSTDGSPAAQIVDMWVLGAVLVLVGVGVYAAEWASQDHGRRF